MNIKLAFLWICLGLFLLVIVVSKTHRSNNMPSEVLDLLNKKFPGWQIPQRDPENEKARLQVLEMTNQQIEAGKAKKSGFPGYDDLANPKDFRVGDFNGDGQKDYVLDIAANGQRMMVAVLGGAVLKDFVLATESGTHRFDFKVFPKGGSFGNDVNFANDVLFFNTYNGHELESSHLCQWSGTQFSCESLEG
jgi:hypothetical protein